MLDKERQLLIKKMKESMSSLNISKRKEERAAEDKCKEEVAKNA